MTNILPRVTLLHSTSSRRNVVFNSMLVSLSYAQHIPMHTTYIIDM